jgi:hypothetical protein
MIGLVKVLSHLGVLVVVVEGLIIDDQIILSQQSKSTFPKILNTNF